MEYEGFVGTGFLDVLLDQMCFTSGPEVSGVGKLAFDGRVVLHRVVAAVIPHALKLRASSSEVTCGGSRSWCVPDLVLTYTLWPDD